MGVVYFHATFDGRAPDPSRIVARAAELTGLPIRYEESSPEIKGELYDFDGHAEFCDMPFSRLRIFAYRSGAVKRHWEQFLGGQQPPDERARQFVERNVMDLNGPEGTQAVHLRIYVGQEPTLMYAAVMALEGLGGRLERPLSDGKRRKYGGKITADELKKRNRKTRAGTLAALFLSCFLLPITLPLWLLSLLVIIPWNIWRAYRLMRKRT